MTRAAVLFVLFLSQTIGAAGEWFDCVLPWDDGSPTLTSWASLNGEAGRPLGRVSVVGSRFADPQGNRLRFLGTNISILPPTETGAAVAGRLAKFGVNVVRFHHLDAGWNENLFRAAWGERTVDLDEAFLVRYDRFRADLAQKGIYSNINLLTGRLFTSADGLPTSVDTISDWKVRHALGFWYRPVLDLQKDFARRLLTRPSVVTGLTPAEDPAVAFVEINNENGLVQTWLNGDLDGLPADLAAPLQQQWNRWVLQRYPDRPRLTAGTGFEAGGPGSVLVSEASHPLARWNLEQHEAARVRSTFGQGPDNAPALRVEVLQVSTEGWHVQLNQPGLAVEAGKTYRLRFQARAEASRTLEAGLMMAHSPWQPLGATARLNLTPGWKPYEVFVSVPTNDTNARINLGGLGTVKGWVEFSGVTFSAGGKPLDPTEDPVRGTLGLVPRGGGGYPRAYVDLWTRFLAETERHYWEDMRDYLVADLGVRSIVVPTILGCTTPEILASFPTMDAHAYWNHPAFPGTPWDANNWFVTNAALVKASDGGTLGALSLYRVEGKPFTVSEYDHPFPNTFGAEGYPLLGAYGAFQDWDGMYSFVYDAADRSGWFSNKVTSFFDQANNPAKMASLLLAAGVFRRGDVEPARQAVVAGRNGPEETARLSVASAWGLGNGASAGLDPRTALVHRTAVDLEGVSSGSPVPPTPPYRSDTGQLLWDSARGLVTVDTPRTKIVTGFPGGQTTEFLDGVVIVPGGTAAATWGLTVKGGDSFTASRAQILVTALGEVRNRGQETRVYGGRPTEVPPEGANLTTQADFGPGPVQMQGVEGRLGIPTLGRSVRAWVLDLTGARLRPLAVTPEGGLSWITLTGAEKALWYEMAFEGGPEPGLGALTVPR